MKPGKNDPAPQRKKISLFPLTADDSLRAAMLIPPPSKEKKRAPKSARHKKKTK